MEKEKEELQEKITEVSGCFCIKTLGRYGTSVVRRVKRVLFVASQSVVVSLKRQCPWCCDTLFGYLCTASR